MNQRSRKPGLKAPPRVQELAARGEASDAEDAADAGGLADADMEASDADMEASDSDRLDDADAVIEAEGLDDTDADAVIEAEGLDGTDRDNVIEVESIEAVSDAEPLDHEGASGDEGVGGAAEVDGSVGTVGATVAAEARSDATTDDAEATDAASGGEDLGSGDGAASDAEATDPLAEMLAEFDAPRPVAPGVQLSEEIPIDPEDDLRTVEGEASLRLVSILESLLFAAAKPLKVQDLRKVLAETTKHQIQLALKYLMAATAERGVVLAQVAGGFQFRTHPENAVWVQKMLQSKPARLSRTQIETLAIVAYRQPITRPEIDNVRGVDSGAVLKTLLERELIQIVGKKEEPGRPLLYGTTVRFLEFFNLRSLRDMPTLRDFRDLSEESKATLRARLGESEAEALGQGVLGLDLSAGPKARVEVEADGEPEDPELDEGGDPDEAGEEVAVEGEEVVGEEVVGEEVVGEAVVGEEVVGEAVVGEAVAVEEVVVEEAATEPGADSMEPVGDDVEDEEGELDGDGEDGRASEEPVGEASDGEDGRASEDQAGEVTRDDGAASIEAPVREVNDGEEGVQEPPDDEKPGASGDADDPGPDIQADTSRDEPNDER